MGEDGSGEITLVKLPMRSASYRCWSAHRNLKIAHFTQQHVDQLVMDTTSLELIQSRLPGQREEEYRHQLGSFGIIGDFAFAIRWEEESTGICTDSHALFLYWDLEVLARAFAKISTVSRSKWLWAHRYQEIGSVTVSANAS